VRIHFRLFTPSSGIARKNIVRVLVREIFMKYIYLDVSNKIIIYLTFLKPRARIGVLNEIEDVSCINHFNVRIDS